LNLVEHPGIGVGENETAKNALMVQYGRPIAEERPRRNGFALRALGAVGLAAVFAASLLLPTSGLGISTCAFRNTFGIPCPGCGLTRSFCAVSHGQLGTAFRSHPLGAIIYAAMLIYMLKWTIEALLRRRLLAQLEDRASVPVLWTLIFSLIGVWILRLATGSLY
jgi:hypothetical protein